MALENICGQYFDKLGKVFKRNFFLVLEAILRCSSSNTVDIARQMSSINNKSFETNEKALYRILTESKFQIDDTFWRCYLNMVFSFLANQQIISPKEKVFIQVDFTSNKDNFLILCASVRCGSRAIPLFFTMRRYPKKAGMIDQKKMELAFLKGLRHLLSKKYQYVIVADRGFGNSRFINNCRQEGFDYLIRLSADKYVKQKEKQFMLSEVETTEGTEEFYVEAWKQNAHIYVSKDEKAKSPWYLTTNLNCDCKKLTEEYKRRFKIEKVFQDLKSSGFNLEDSKIRKYDRYKRLFFLSAMVHALLVLVGKCVDEDYPKLKKTSLLLTNVLSAYSNLPESFFLYTSRKL